MSLTRCYGTFVMSVCSTREQLVLKRVALFHYFLVFTCSGTTALLRASR